MACDYNLSHMLSLELKILVDLDSWVNINDIRLLCFANLHALPK